MSIVSHRKVYYFKVMIFSNSEIRNYSMSKPTLAWNVFFIVNIIIDCCCSKAPDFILSHTYFTEV